MRLMPPESPLFPCGLCGFLVPEVQKVEAGCLGTTARSFCSVCAIAIRREIERTRADRGRR